MGSLEVVREAAAEPVTVWTGERAWEVAAARALSSIMEPDCLIWTIFLGGRGGNDSGELKVRSPGGMGVLLTGDNSVINAGQIHGGGYGNTGSDGDAVVMAPAIVALGDRNKIVNAGALHSGGNIAVRISGSDNHFEIRDGAITVGATIADGYRNKFVLGGDDDYFFMSQNWAILIAARYIVGLIYLKKPGRQHGRCLEGQMLRRPGRLVWEPWS